MRVFFICVVLSVLAATCVMAGGLDITIGDAREVTTVSVAFTVRNTSDSAVFVPTCGYAEDGAPGLCTLNVDIERLVEHAWTEQTPSACECALLGGVPATAGITLAPGEARALRFSFSPSFYAFKHGDVLRLRLETWPSSASFAEKHATKYVVTPQFSMP